MLRLAEAGLPMPVDTRGLNQGHVGKRMRVELADGELLEIRLHELTVCAKPEPCCGITYVLISTNRSMERETRAPLIGLRLAKLKVSSFRRLNRMQPFSTHTGMVCRSIASTSTRIRWCRTIFEGAHARRLGPFFSTIGAISPRKTNPDFVLNFPRYKAQSVLLARANFGGGSSREHAPWAVKTTASAVVIAPVTPTFLQQLLQERLSSGDASRRQVDEISSARKKKKAIR